MSSHLSDHFFQSSQEVTGKALDALRQNYFIEAKMRGSGEASIGGLNINTSGRHDSAAMEKEQRERASSDAAFLSLLEDMRQRLDELNRDMARLSKQLTAKYGTDYVSGMADTFLSDEERAGAASEEDKLKALAGKFLDSDGNIKEKYAHLPEAQYVHDWNEARKLEPVVAKYEGRNELSADEQREVYATVQSVGLAGQENMYTESSNKDFKDTVEVAMDNEHQSQAHFDNGTTSFSFGK